MLSAKFGGLALKGVAGKHSRQLERIAQALRSLGDTPMTQARAECLAQWFGFHWVTIYHYRSRLAGINDTTAIAAQDMAGRDGTFVLYRNIV